MTATTHKATLTRASQELFRRTTDERFDSLSALHQHCQRQRDDSTDKWVAPDELLPRVIDGRLDLQIGTQDVFRLTDWSFGQLCRLGGVSKDTLNKLSAETAGRALIETVPRVGKPMQTLTLGGSVRSIHGTAYTRLDNVDLLNVVAEFATDFQPAQKAAGGGTGLYCGEQDMFVFLIDPVGWCEIEGEAFAPGFFLWNSEVGRRSVGVQTFWFQAVCANHIVWDAVEVIDFARKHTAGVRECLTGVRTMIDDLARKRDERRDGFARVMANAFKSKLGDGAEEVAKVLAKHGIPRDFAKQALELAERQGRFTVFSLVDALTRIAGGLANAGERLELDERAGRLLTLAAN
jgi:hypothetical protein